MKQQLHAPAFIPPKKPEDLLKSLVWLQGLEDDAVTYITSNAEMLSFDFGDVILKQGEVCDGIYLIISGMVKVSCDLFSIYFYTIYTISILKAVSKYVTKLWLLITREVKSLSLIHI